MTAFTGPSDDRSLEHAAPSAIPLWLSALPPQARSAAAQMAETAQERILARQVARADAVAAAQTAAQDAAAARDAAAVAPLLGLLPGTSVDARTTVVRTIAAVLDWYDLGDGSAGVSALLRRHTGEEEVPASTVTACLLAGCGLSCGQVGRVLRRDHATISYLWGEGRRHRRITALEQRTVRAVADLRAQISLDGAQMRHLAEDIATAQVPPARTAQRPADRYRAAPPRQR